jgi:hypothetical protein
MNMWHSILERSPMGPACPVNGIEGNIMGQLEGITMRLNMYKIVIHIEVVGVSECVSLQWCGVFESVKRDDQDWM